MGLRHEGVLLAEVLDYLQPRVGLTIVDLTLGGGSYAAALLERGARVIGIDADPDAVVRGQDRLSRFGENFSAHRSGFVHFGRILDEMDLSRVDGICMDLGLSSIQLDDPKRGFAFRLDGPLDLRFDPTQGEPASARLSDADADSIAAWLREYGEVRRPRVIAKAFAAAASEGALQTTTQARDIVTALTPGPRKEGELARVFQALRILCNSELDQLRRTLTEVPDRLRTGGRMVVVSYHSLEDRLVKQMLRRESGREEGSRHLPAPSTTPARMKSLTKKPVRPTEAEVARNPRARSAKLRAGERI